MLQTQSYGVNCIKELFSHDFTGRRIFKTNIWKGKIRNRRFNIDKTPVGSRYLVDNISLFRDLILDAQDRETLSLVEFESSLEGGDAALDNL